MSIIIIIIIFSIYVCIIAFHYAIGGRGIGRGGGGFFWAKLNILYVRKGLVVCLTVWDHRTEVNWEWSTGSEEGLQD